MLRYNSPHRSSEQRTDLDSIHTIERPRPPRRASPSSDLLYEETLARTLRFAVEQLPPQIELLVISDHVDSETALHRTRVRRDLLVIELRLVDSSHSDSRGDHSGHEHVLESEIPLAQSRLVQGTDAIRRQQVRRPRREVREHASRKLQSGHVVLRLGRSLRQRASQHLAPDGPSRVRSRRRRREREKSRNVNEHVVVRLQQSRRSRTVRRGPLEHRDRLQRQVRVRVEELAAD